MPRRAPLLAGLQQAAVAALLFVNLATLLTLLAERWWPFDVLANFAVQFAFIQLIGLASCILWRAWRLGLLTLPILLINLVPIAGYYVGNQAATAAPSGPTLRVMALNLWARNDRIDLVEAAVRAESPDVIAFAEVTSAWRERLAVLRASYPYWHQDDAHGWSDLLMVSRVPFRDAGVQPLGKRGKTALSATICGQAAAPERCIELLSAHLERPEGGYFAGARNEHLDAIATLIAGHDPGNTVLVGDFNLTPWSPYFGRLLAMSGLRDSERGRGVSPTWLSRWLPLGLSIDHILVGSAVTVQDRHVGADVGSDHLPVIADLTF